MWVHQNISQIAPNTSNYCLFKETAPRELTVFVRGSCSECEIPASFLFIDLLINPLVMPLLNLTDPLIPAATEPLCDQVIVTPALWVTPLLQLGPAGYDEKNTNTRLAVTLFDRNSCQWITETEAWMCHVQNSPVRKKCHWHILWYTGMIQQDSAAW